MNEFSFFRITGENQVEMAGMLPEDVCMALRKELPVTAFAVTEGDTVIGALAGAANGDFFDIASLYVAPPYRRRGAGTALMKRLFTLLDEEELMARVELGAFSGDEPSLTPFLISLGFEKETVEYPPYFSAPLEQFRTDTEAAEAGNGRILSFSEVPAELLEELCEDADGKEDQSGTWNLLSDTVDPENSFCLIRDDAIAAFAAADTAVGEPARISLVWAMEEDLADARIMLTQTLKGFKEKYHPDTKIVMLAMGPGAEEAAEAVCPDASFAGARFVRAYYEEL